MKWFQTIAAALAINLSIGLGVELVALAQGYVPPDMGIPGRRRGAGTRTPEACVSQEPTLTALLPENSYGQTIDATPTWFWYMPATSAATVQFSLLDRDGNSVYEATIAAPPSGVVSLSLPGDAALAIDTDYRWYFTILCNPDDPSADVFTQGWLRRVQPNASLTQQLESNRDRASVYAENSLWYDAIAEIAAARRTAPSNSAAEAAWRSLLESVDLDDVAEMPLSPTDVTPTEALP